ncbi:MAG: hypothetical protein Q3983_07740 [Capnocytophaga sp.]|nr:hypothetical protein [Capnocytophaga sp.]
MAKKLREGYAKIISDAQVMTAGLESKATEVAKRGLTEEFITQLKQVRQEAIDLNNEQERLKAELKTKTDALNTKLDLLLSQLSEARKVVKLAIPQTGWKEFGIESSR